MKSKKIVGVIALSLMLMFSFSFITAESIPATLEAGTVGESEFQFSEDLPHEEYGALQSSLWWETDWQIKNGEEIVYSSLEQDYVASIELLLFPADEITDENLFDALSYPDVFLVSDDGLSTTYNAEINEIVFGVDGQALKNLGDTIFVSTLELSVETFDGVDGDLLITGGGSEWLMYPPATNPPSVQDLEQAYGLGVSNVNSIVVDTTGIIAQIVVFDLSGTYYWIAKETDDPWDLTTSSMHYGYSSSTDNYNALAFAPSGNYDSWILI